MTMNAPNLEDALAQAGSAVKLLWKPNAPAAVVPVVKPEFSSWREEQWACEQGVALLDLSHHMADLYIDGPDAVALLSYVSANNYQQFAVGQAKQFICVSPDGFLIQDGILVRLAEDRFNLIGIGAAHNWVSYHAMARDYRVKLTFDPPSNFRNGDPIVYRYQLQGPRAEAVLKKLFGSSLDGVKFFHFREVNLAGHRLNALRHGMAGQAGFEFFGPWEYAASVRDAILEAGEEFMIQQVGGLAYYSLGVDSGWLATPVPAIYTQDSLKDYRKFVSLFSYEGMGALQGSYYSPRIEDYYCTPFELGYGRSISFGHEFIGQEALAKKKDDVKRVKMTLVWNESDVKNVFGKDHGFILSYAKDRVEVNGNLAGVSEYATFVDPAGTVHSLAMLNREHAVAGKEVSLLWGQHPGPTAGPDYQAGFQKIRAVVQPAPFNDYARTKYRAS